MAHQACIFNQSSQCPKNQPENIFLSYPLKKARSAIIKKCHSKKGNVNKLLPKSFQHKFIIKNYLLCDSFT